MLKNSTFIETLEKAVKKCQYLINENTSVPLHRVNIGNAFSMESRGYIKVRTIQGAVHRVDICNFEKYGQTDKQTLLQEEQKL